jgi:hypothetical protein
VPSAATVPAATAPPMPAGEPPPMPEVPKTFQGSRPSRPVPMSVRRPELITRASHEVKSLRASTATGAGSQPRQASDGGWRAKR